MLFLLLLLLDVLDASTHHYYAYMARLTNVTCETTRQCLTSPGNSLWCRSGLTCINGLCNVVPELPCSHNHWCDEEAHTCHKQVCRASDDCDDGLFCNGIELCSNGYCRAGAFEHCYGGYCDEAVHACSYPKVLTQWHGQLQQSGVMQVETRPRLLLFKGQHHDNHSHDDDEFHWTQQDTIIALIVSVIFAIIILVFCFIVTVAGRSGTSIIYANEPLPTY
jgi:hypothetical protein